MISTSRSTALYLAVSRLTLITTKQEEKIALLRRHNNRVWCRWFLPCLFMLYLSLVVFCLIISDDKRYIQSAKANKQNKEKQLLSNWLRAYSLDHFNPTTNCLGDSWNPWTISNTDLRKEKKVQKTSQGTNMVYAEYVTHKRPKTKRERTQETVHHKNKIKVKKVN